MRNGDDSLSDFKVAKFKIFPWAFKACTGTSTPVDVESDEEDKTPHTEDDGLLLAAEVVFKVLPRAKGGCDSCVAFKTCDGTGDESNEDEETEHLGLEVLVLDPAAGLDDCRDTDTDLGTSTCTEWEDDEVTTCKGDVLMVLPKVTVLP